MGGAGIAIASVSRNSPGLILVMLAAIVFHANRGETQQIVMNVVILAVAAFVAYGRLRVAPLLERGAARV